MASLNYKTKERICKNFSFYFRVKRGMWGTNLSGEDLQDGRDIPFMRFRGEKMRETIK